MDMISKQQYAVTNFVSVVYGLRDTATSSHKFYISPSTSHHQLGGFLDNRHATLCDFMAIHFNTIPGCNKDGEADRKSIAVPHSVFRL